MVLVVKNLLAIAGIIRNASLTSGSGRSPGGWDDNPLQYSCLENPMDRGAWWATVHGVAKSRTQLKRLSINETKTHGQRSNHLSDSNRRGSLSCAHLIADGIRDFSSLASILTRQRHEGSMDWRAWYWTQIPPIQPFAVFTNDVYVYMLGGMAGSASCLSHHHLLHCRLHFTVFQTLSISISSGYCLSYCFSISLNLSNYLR